MRVADNESALSRLLIAPALIYIGLIIGTPFVLSLWFAVSDVTVSSAAGHFIGMENFRSAEWTTHLLGEDVKARYADLKQASADRCSRALGTFVKAPEVQYHHDVYNQFLWNLF